jgi:metallophosphoesterase superfamily enzyme
MRVMMPAFGAYAGGLDVRDRAIAELFPRGGRVFLLGQDRLFSFALAASRGRVRRDTAGRGAGPLDLP